MPHESEEGKSRRNGISLNIAAWWRKFHFSGRVIMCSVLLGLGLILIGGLIFAINIDDDNSKVKSDDPPNEITTKAPSHYTGPVVMGIGGFIVVVGVVMCLFETQVCRKRTGDSSPLISDKRGDPEGKDSDTTPQPSTSQGHKSHKHGTRKRSASPRKAKNHHAKSHSKERNQQKSPKSPPIFIESPKHFMTSSEDNFLTPPNTIEENPAATKNDNSHDSDDKHSSLMKSFASSGPSWNQSAEFLTPSTSFRDTSVSISNSVEIDENEEITNLETTGDLSPVPDINSECLTPLTIEEDRIQQLLLRVKHEQKQMTGSNLETSSETTEHSSSDISFGSPQVQNEIVKEGEVDKNLEKGNGSINELLSKNIISHSVPEEDVQRKMYTQAENIPDLNQNKYERNSSEEDCKHANNVIQDEISYEIIDALEEENISLNEEQEGIPSQSDSTLPTYGSNSHALDVCSDEGTSRGKVDGQGEQTDLESSVSSGETVVSSDNFKDKLINNGSSMDNNTSSTFKENASEETEFLSTSKSPDSDISTTDKDVIDHLNIEANLTNQNEDAASDLNYNQNNDTEVVLTTIESISNDETS